MDEFDAVGEALDTLAAALDALGKVTKTGIPRDVAAPTLHRMKGYCTDMQAWLVDLNDERGTD